MALIDDVAAPYALIGGPTRLIGTIIPDVVVAELHQDAVAITDHPVEIGAPVTDHAFILPSRVEMRLGYSDSSAGYIGYSREAYEAFLALAAEREPFDLFTAKRAYSSMLVETIVTDTTDKTPNAAMIVLRLRKVLLTYATGGGGGIAPNAAQVSPQTTGSVASIGPVQPVETGLTIGTVPGSGAFGLGGPFGNALA